MEYQEIVLSSTELFFFMIKGLAKFSTGAYILKSPYDWVYALNGQIHRDGGPAQISIITYNVSGKNDYCFKYYSQGKLHNENGPAMIVYSMNQGDPIVEDYYLNGERLEQHKWQQQVQTKLYW